MPRFNQCVYVYIGMVTCKKNPWTEKNPTHKLQHIVDALISELILDTLKAEPAEVRDGAEQTQGTTTEKQDAFLEWDWPFQCRVRQVLLPF